MIKNSIREGIEIQVIGYCRGKKWFYNTYISTDRGSDDTTPVIFGGWLPQAKSGTDRSSLRDDETLRMRNAGLLCPVFYGIIMLCNLLSGNEVERRFTAGGGTDKPAGWQPLYRSIRPPASSHAYLRYVPRQRRHDDYIRVLGSHKRREASVREGYRSEHP